MIRKSFTVDDANQLIPVLDQVFRSIDQKKERVRRHGKKLEVLSLLWGDKVGESRTVLIRNGNVFDGTSTELSSGKGGYKGVQKNSDGSADVSAAADNKHFLGRHLFAPSPPNGPGPSDALRIREPGQQVLGSLHSALPPPASAGGAPPAADEEA